MRLGIGCSSRLAYFRLVGAVLQAWAFCRRLLVGGLEAHGRPAVRGTHALVMLSILESMPSRIRARGSSGRWLVLSPLPPTPRKVMKQIPVKKLNGKNLDKSFR